MNINLISLNISVLTLITLPLNNEYDIISVKNTPLLEQLSPCKSKILEPQIYLYLHRAQKLAELLIKENLNGNQKQQKDVFKQQSLIQYLRKFSFLYKYYILKSYPNDLTEINQHKMNIVAVKNLYILSNI